MIEAVLPGVLISAFFSVLLIRLQTIERRLNRLSRVDAKIDALLQHAGLPFDEFANVPADVREALERGRTIMAIMRYRQATGAGLKEARDFIDEIQRRGAAAS